MNLDDSIVNALSEENKQEPVTKLEPEFVEPEAVEPVEPVETVEAAQAEEPAETVEAEEPVEAAQAEEPAETVETEEPVETVETEEPVETVEAAQAAQAEEPAETVETEEPVEPVEAEEPVETVQAEELVETVQAEELAETVQAEEPVEEPLEEPVEAEEPVETVEAAQAEIVPEPLQEPLPDTREFETYENVTPISESEYSDTEYSENIHLVLEDPEKINIDEIHENINVILEEIYNDNSSLITTNENVNMVKLTKTDKKSNVPDVIFIIPYRNRENDKLHFLSHMPNILKKEFSKKKYELYFIEQSDTRSFNRGAIKNIGFIIIRQLYPNDYKNITIVFNDVDTTPCTDDLFTYDTRPGIIKHFYGFTYALGGILSIKAADFEKLNGFPNYWGWGFEDNLLYKRAKKMNLTIDRSQFFPIFDAKILTTNKENIKSVNRSDFERYIIKTNDGIDSIYHINYVLEPDVTHKLFKVNHFETTYPENLNTISEYDTANGPMPFKCGYSARRGSRIVMHMS